MSCDVWVTWLKDTFLVGAAFFAVPLEAGLPLDAGLALEAGLALAAAVLVFAGVPVTAYKRLNEQVVTKT